MSEPLTDMLPPWEEFPAYERYTIGWRMGPGETYLGNWFDFTAALPKDYESRLAYLKRHRPAPLNWGDTVLSVLYPDSKSDQEYGCSEAETTQLLELGLITQDAAYQTWLLQQSDISWPWKFPMREPSPEKAARYATREFWFFSRQLNTNRDASPEAVPRGWQKVETEVLTGQLGDIDPSLGLLTLAKMLCAGTVQPPWQYGLLPTHVTNSFEMDMGFCDAYLLWLISSFDDDALVKKIFESTNIPSDWLNLIQERTKFG